LSINRQIRRILKEFTSDKYFNNCSVYFDYCFQCPLSYNAVCYKYRSMKRLSQKDKQNMINKYIEWKLMK